MRHATTLVQWIIRVVGLAQIGIGLLLWTDHARSLQPVHMALGGAFVLSLWALALIAWRQRAGVWQPVIMVLIGLGVAELGMHQVRLLVGTQHWVIRLTHLVVGLGAMGFAERLSARSRTSGYASSQAR